MVPSQSDIGKIQCRVQALRRVSIFKALEASSPGVKMPINWCNKNIQRKDNGTIYWGIQWPLLPNYFSICMLPDDLVYLIFWGEICKSQISCKMKVVDLPDTAALWSPFAAISTICTSSKPLTDSGRLTDLILSLETPNWPRFPEPNP